jgi:hypothetical protein
VSAFDVLKKLAGPPTADQSPAFQRTPKPGAAKAAGAAAAKVVKPKAPARRVPAKAPRGPRGQTDYGPKKSTSPGVDKAAGHVGYSGKKR